MHDNDPQIPEVKTWKCDCGTVMYRYQGERGDQTCPRCGQWYNAFGQRLRDDWMSNPALYDDDLDDLEGFEISQLGD